ncbi:hypothetical protein CCS79_08900 [Clostridium diolis]|uniref:nuclease-related domain-containing DEAD/DEAH box helicase n=1 Tax=Clostridium diolis TaxID=223919 RepID=UPI000B3FA40C|nr:NERD domain-containing protein/DEAD/DEAH box helicase [Clostridium diolis]OVE69034.1 hypothetical protein CCS79_08900 [Clostridium diolis]
MARIYPELTDAQLDELKSQAEANVYKCFRSSLDEKYIVIHSQSYVAKCKDGGHKDGEADFVIFSANYGLLIVEVKGGGVMYDPKIGWSSIDVNNKVNEIKNPIEQAKNQKFAILEQLKSDPMWMKMNRRIPIGHAVLFPDINSVKSLKLPECPKEIIGSKAVLKNVNGWLENVYKYWNGTNNTPLGEDGLQVVEQILCSPIYVRPLLRDILDADDKQRIQLTNEQASVLRTLARCRRAGIVGAAGTGKTILATEKARILASKKDTKVLIICYNKALGVTLKKQFTLNKQVLACTFHQFCLYCIDLCVKKGITNPLEQAKREMPNDDYYNIQLPLAAYYAIEELKDELRFDAIIIDEGQDFGEEYWLPLDIALRESENSWLYVFYDENQRLYSRASTFPIAQNDTFPLTRNCRNAKPVHELAYKYYDGEPVDDSGIDGIKPIPLEADSYQAQAKQIIKFIVKLINDENVKPESIAVLVACTNSTNKKSIYDLLCAEKLPENVFWSIEEHFSKKSVLIDTVKRFKGLERDVIFLWVNQESIVDDALMYVGISRAKSALYVVGDRESLQDIGFH